MKSTVIDVHNLSKDYKYKSTQPYLTLRDSLVNVLKGVVTVKQNKQIQKNHFWALKDISFEVKQGEVLGIIGANGSGKSTLLKILSRITPPTHGKAILKGRVASLLEVGTGFHQELSGRENIFLNGAILGMKRKEIKEKYDQIVEFAGIGKFIDTPVKKYSSGMYVRLAFAVAAHLESEILLIDEVLAVGDYEFQQKSLNKVKGIAQSGRTVIFISHDMQAIRGLCTQALMLDKGKIVAQGDTDEVVSRYLKTNLKKAQTSLIKRKDRLGNGKARFTKVWLEDTKGKKIKSANNTEDFTIVFQIRSSQHLKNTIVSFSIIDPRGQRLAINPSDLYKKTFNLKPGVNVITCGINLPLLQGKYTIGIHLSSGPQTIDSISDALILDLRENNFFGTNRSLKEQKPPLLIKSDWLQL